MGGEKTLFVIVHPGCVSQDMENGDEDAHFVGMRLDEIRQSYKFIELGKHDDPKELHPDMLSPSDDLTVVLAGAYVDYCIANQTDVLVRRRYNVQLDPEGCLD